jgi:hypothetical protein
MRFLLYMSRIKQLLLYIPLLALAAGFAVHAGLALLQSPEHVAIVSVLQLGPVLTKWLVYAIFPLDGCRGIAYLWRSYLCEVPMEMALCMGWSVAVGTAIF